MNAFHKARLFLKRQALPLALLILPGIAHAQDNATQLGDSIRAAYYIPELGFAVVKADTVLATYLAGYHRVDRKGPADTAQAGDYFHLGSNTKAITGLIAGRLVEQKKIGWTTPFFRLFPDWKAGSDTGFHAITLADLLAHDARIPAFTSGPEYKGLPPFKGDPAARRKQFAKYILAQKPVAEDGQPFHYSNAGYSLAALMLEQVSGRSWEALVKEVLGDKLKLRYTLGWPNRMDAHQPWGHWFEGLGLKALPPDHEYDLNLVEPAGDISMPLADYARLIQMHLQGLAGQDNILKASTYTYLHTSRPDYAIGWANVQKDGKEISVHSGSAGTFFCQTVIDRKKGVAYIAVANAGGTAEKGVTMLLRRLAGVYGG